MTFSGFTVCKNKNLITKSRLLLIVKIMFAERFWPFFKKNEFIKKNLEQSQKEREGV